MSFSALTVMAVRNERDIIAHTVHHLVSQGIRVRILDNWSTDGTWELLPALPIESYSRFPASGPTDTYSCRFQQSEVDRLMAESDADWCMYHDADEIRRSPIPGETLLQMFERTSTAAAGYNAIAFDLFCFQPTDDLYDGTVSPEDHFKWFDPTHIDSRNYHIKAWANQHVPIGLGRWESGGGHRPAFLGMRVSPEHAWLKHYPVRGQRHGEIKITERLQMFDPAERARGWHVQYNGMQPPYNFIHDKSSLTYWPNPVYTHSLPKVTLVTLSRYADIFLPLDASIREHNIDSSIAAKILVLDAAADESTYPIDSLTSHGWTILRGQSPFIFSRNVNLGLQSSNSAHDILLIGDDGRFLCPNTIEQLRTAAYADPTIGILSPQISGGTVGQRIQMAPASYSSSMSFSGRHQRKPPDKHTGMIYADSHLCFVCVYIKRSTIDRVGLLDERFTGYGSDDVDYCRRTIESGLRLAVTPAVQISHGHQSEPASVSFNRVLGSNRQREKSMREMVKVLADKYTAPIPASFLSGGITLITPTGGRPEAFALLEKSIARQTYTGNLQWICVDDMDPVTSFTMNQTVIRPKPLWTLGDRSTQRRNMLATIPLVHYDKILVIEDEDYLSPAYLQTMYDRLDFSPIAGQINAHYYNVRYRTYMECHNTQHASLCQTGIRASLLPDLRWACEQTGVEFIDIALWSRHTQSRGLFGGPALCVGIKGMPGRAGAAVGHNLDRKMLRDPEMSMLRSWIGDGAELYAQFYAAPSISVSRRVQPVRGRLQPMMASGARG